MNAQARHASLILDSVAKAISNWIVDQHAEANPRLAERYGPTWRADWIGHTVSQLQVLGQAVAVQSVSLFVHSSRWNGESFAARNIDQDDLIKNTECMREVLSKELPPPVAAIALQYVDASLEDLSARNQAADTSATHEPRRHKLVLQYLEAILEGNRTKAESIALAALDEMATIPATYEKILAPAQACLGQMWHRGEISIADEHFGSATTQAVMSQFRPRFQRAQPNGRTLIASSTHGDLHDIGLRMVSDLFEIDGWNVIYLGANTPTVDVMELLARHSPDLLVLSVSTPFVLRDVGDLIDGIRQDSAMSGTKILIGGTVFDHSNKLWQELGADGFASSATQAVKIGNQLFA